MPIKKSLERSRNAAKASAKKRKQGMFRPSACTPHARHSPQSRPDPPLSLCSSALPQPPHYRHRHHVEHIFVRRSEVVHLRLSTQLMCQGFCLCVRLCCCCLRGSAARLGGATRRLSSAWRGDEPARLSSARLTRLGSAVGSGSMAMILAAAAARPPSAWVPIAARIWALRRTRGAGAAAAGCRPADPNAQPQRRRRWRDRRISETSCKPPPHLGKLRTAGVPWSPGNRPAPPSPLPSSSALPSPSLLPLLPS